MSFQNTFGNTVIQQTASKSHNIYIMSLYDHNKDIFSKPGLSYGSSVNGPKNGRFYPAYVWDLYEVAKKIGGELSKDPNREGHYPTTFLPSMPWRPIFCNSFSDSSGSAIYSPLKNFLPVNINNSPVFSAQKYTGNFSLSPLININLSSEIQSVVSTKFKGMSQYANDQAGGELILYFASKIPLLPLMICSSINSHYSYGPVFLENITFQVSGDSNLGAVEIQCSFTGGKSLISPEINLLKKQKPGIEPIVFYGMNDLEGNYQGEKAANFLDLGIDYDYHRYRSANLLDVLVFKEYLPNFEAMLLKSKIPQVTIPDEKIIGVTLEISQEITFDYTNPKIYVDNVVKNMNDKFGPRFAYLTGRTVKGSIKYFGFTKTEKIQRTSGLTLYFGGPFYFPMKNVDWSNPSISIVPGGGYIFTYNFIARLAEGLETGFPDSPENVYEKNVSEFTYDSFSVNSNNFLGDWIGSFINNLKSGFGIQ